MSIESTVFFSGELEFARASWDDQNGNSVKFWLVEDPKQPFTENPFKQHTRRRAGHAGTQFHISVVTVEPMGADPKPIYSGEAMLADWGDTRSGQYVVVWLPEGEHPFAGMTRRAKSQSGTRFMAAFQELDDDGELIDQRLRNRAEKPRQNLSEYAALLCKDANFHAFLAQHTAPVEGDQRDWAKTPEGFTWNEATAAEWVRQMCQVPTRAMLDVDPVAAKRFHERIRLPYMRFMGGDW